MTYAVRPSIRPGGLIAFLFAASGYLMAADASLVAPSNRIDPENPEWRSVAGQFSRERAIVAEFEELRFFPFRHEAIALAGTVRIAPRRGLSLHYTRPEERTMILDDQGTLMRDRNGAVAAPADPRMEAANTALLHILQFDLAALAPSFELYGRIEGGRWSLALVPRVEAVRRAIGDIYVDGEDAAVRRIELHRSAKQHIDISIFAARPAAFTPEELKQFFR